MKSRILATTAAYAEIVARCTPADLEQVWATCLFGRRLADGRLAPIVVQLEQLRDVVGRASRARGLASAVDLGRPEQSV